MKNTYVVMLRESLESKEKVLDEVIALDNEQMELLKAENMDNEAFDETMDRKEKLIQRIEKMDDGFETVYERVREEIIANKENYKDEIVRMQKLITSVTEKNVAIKAQEARIKSSLDLHIKRQHAGLQQKRDAGKAVMSYHNNMSRVNLVDPQFMDKKK